MATNILMPALSPTMEEGKLARWLVKEGDTVKSGDILAEIETDKATMEFEAVDEGRIGKILVPEGSEGVKVNAPIAVLLGEGEKAGDVDIPAAMKSIGEAVKAEAPKKPEPPRPMAAPKAEPAKAEPRRRQNPSPRRVRKARASSPRRWPAASPPARASTWPRSPAPARAGVSSRPMSKRRSRAPKPAAAVAAAAGAAMGVSALPDAKLFYKPEDYEEIPHDSMRKAIARRLTSAKTLIPHYYLTIDCNLDALMATRARLNEAAAAQRQSAAYKLSVNDFVVKAAAMALDQASRRQRQLDRQSASSATNMPMSGSPWRWISA